MRAVQEERRQVGRLCVALAWFGCLPAQRKGSEKEGLGRAWRRVKMSR